MTDTGHANPVPGLGPARLTAVVTALPPVGAPDGVLGRLFDLPDTQAGVNMYRRLAGWGSDAALVRCCVAAHQMAARWFGTARPQAIAAIEALQRYAALASASCGTLRTLLANADTDPKARQQSVAIIEELRSRAVEESQTWAALGVLVGQLSSQMQIVVPQIVRFDQQYNIWDVDPYETQGQIDQAMLTHVFQELEGAWAAFGADAANVATALGHDVEDLPDFIAQLGLDEAQGEWQDLATHAGRTLPSSPARTPAATQLGWVCVEVSDSGDRYLDYRLQAGSGDPVAFGKDSGQSVVFERLSGDQCGYFRIRFTTTNRYLTGSSSGALVQADWADAEHQKWRPQQINQFSLNACTISGFCLIQHTTGLLACVDAPNPDRFSPITRAGDAAMSLSQRAALPTPPGLSVFQATVEPFGSVY
jgi:hypothetical protein